MAEVERLFAEALELPSEKRLEFLQAAGGEGLDTQNLEHLFGCAQNMGVVRVGALEGIANMLALSSDRAGAR